MTTRDGGDPVKGEDERPKRPKLARREPVRQWPLGAVGATTPPAAATGEAPRDAVGSAVEMGYRVVDEYIRQGQKVARQMSEGGGAAALPASDWGEAATRITQLTTEWMGMWFEFAQRAVSGAGVRAADIPTVDLFGATARPTPAPAAPAAQGQRSRVRIEIKTSRPAEVSLDLHPDHTGEALIVHNLRGADAQAPRLGVVFEAAAEGRPALLSIQVPADQPAGVYSGAIVHAATNRAVGTLTIQIGEPS